MKTGSCVASMLPLLLVLVLVLVLGPAGCDDDGGGGGADGDADADTDADTDSDSDTEPECDPEDLYWIWDLSVMPPQDAQICARVRATGENVYVLVADHAWGGSVIEQDIGILLSAWDDATPTEPQAGIFDQVAGLFGDPPDVFDDDPRIYLFLYEMAGYAGHTFDGYFRVTDQLDAPTSNRREMLHINSLSGGGPSSDYMLSVQAHEFQHLIHWGHDPYEEPWLNEAMSELAMVLTGFGHDEAWLDYWIGDPSDPLMAPGPAYNYGILLLLGTYLWERFGDDFIRALVADTATGVAGLDNLLVPMDPVRDFAEVLGDLALAIAVNDVDLAAGEFGFSAIDFDEVASTGFAFEDAATVTVIADGGFAFFSSNDAAADRQLEIASESWESLEVRAAFSGPGGGELILDGLVAATTVVGLGAWPAGATLWVAAANPGAAAASLQVGLD